MEFQGGQIEAVQAISEGVCSLQVVFRSWGVGARSFDHLVAQTRVHSSTRKSFCGQSSNEDSNVAQLPEVLVWFARR